MALATMVATVLAPGAAAETKTAEGAAAVEGAVQTLAGPGYCPGPATPVAGSREVRALAIDDEGRVFYETGPGDDRSVIATLKSRAETQQHVDDSIPTWPSGVPQPAVPSGAPPATQQTPAGAGRLVPTDGEGVIIASGTRLSRVSQDTRSTFAGDPTSELGGVGPQRAGDHGPATDARFRSATSLARDAAGNLFVADHGGSTLAHATIRFINRSEEPVTFYAGTPEEVTVEPGHIATIAGVPSPDQANQGDTVESPREAAFYGNTTIAVEENRLYVAHARAKSTSEAVVDLVNLGGEEVTAHGHTVQPGGIQPVAGGGDNPEKTIEAAAGIAVAGDDVYVADPARHRIRHLDAEGFMATFAGAEGLGATVGGFNGNRRPAVGARLDQPFDVAAGPDGQVYIADRGNGQVRVVDDSGRIRGLPGAGVGLTWQCHAAEDSTGRPAQPQPGGPASVAVDDQGAAYFALADAHLVKRRGPDGRVTTVAGDTGQGCQPGCAGFAGDGGPADQAVFDTPTAVALSPKGGLYVYDGGNARIRYINLTDDQVTVHGVTIPAGAVDTVAGTGTPGAGGDDGPARQTNLAEVANPGLLDHGARAARGRGFELPQSNFGDLAVDDAGNLFIAEPRQHPDGGAFQPGPGEQPEPLDAQVRKVDPHGELTTVAGDNAPREAAKCCRDPAALALGPAGNLFIADADTDRIWLLDRTDQPTQSHGLSVKPGEVTAVAGTGTPGFAGTRGNATDSDLLPPAGLTIDEDGTLYLAQLGILQGNDPGHYIHAITSDGELELLAGNGQPGFNGDALDPRLTSLNLPTDLTVDGCGNLLVADAGNDRLRRVNLNPPCNPTASQATQPANTGGLSTLDLGLLAVALAAAGTVAGWYWRRRLQHASRP